MPESVSASEFSFEQKERLARRIQKLKKPKYYLEIEKIITDNNPQLDITENPSGKFMYFQNLTSETYVALEKYVRKILKVRVASLSEDGGVLKLSSPALSSENAEDPFLSNSTGNGKLKYSNKERNLIKRKMYDEEINKEQSEASTNQVFVKRKLVQNSISKKKETM
ncbi:MAG: hypothetical protein Hyperionvirus8_58 [Hyperionvirus sp.]|uniref:Uncharacterized protein n=1 Tax=Hyperionvirus sp. TaxID=2487770 RepID=A0A3G5AAK6_9VIRU|nr:MAG: hypothetical protein Hyperionvirus8_58 [Hyperionvirus sp.]